MQTIVHPRRWVSPLLGAAALALIAGCTVQPEPSPQPMAPVPAQVEFSDIDLRSDLAIGTVKMWRDPSQLLHVDVPARNLTQSSMPIDWRVTYYDVNGIPIDQPSGWAAVTLSPNVFQDIMNNCSTPRGYDFKMDLRYAR
jgi:hypothetical protein